MDPMPAMYSAIEAIADGKIAEAEIDVRRTEADDSEWTLTITVRREVRRVEVHPSNPS